VFLFRKTAFADSLHFHKQKHNDNPCGVVASFTPSDDSVINLYDGNIQLQSTSINATSLKWYVNDLYTFNTSPQFHYSLQTGTYKIMLVASNGTCSDTAYAYYFCPGTPHGIDSVHTNVYGFSFTDEEGTCIDNTAEGGYILGGSSYHLGINSITIQNSYLVKTRKSGCIDWSKFIEMPYSSGSVTSVLGCADSSILVLWNEGYFLARLDKDGNVLWQKKLLSSYSTYLNFFKLAEDANGNIYALGSVDFAAVVCKMDPQGTPLWTKEFRFSRALNDFTDGTGITVINNELYVSGIAYTEIINNASAYSVGTSYLMKLDPATGSRIWTKAYSMNGGNTYFESLSHYGSMPMVSATSAFSGDKLGHSIVMIDGDGQFVKGTHFTHHDNNKTTLTSYFNDLTGSAESDPQGNIYINDRASQTLSLQPGIALYSYMLKLDPSFNLVWGMTFTFYNRTQFLQGALNQDNDWACIGTDVGYAGAGNWVSRNISVVKADSSFLHSRYCFYDTDGFDFFPVQFSSRDISPIIDTALKLDPPVTNYSFNTVYSQSRSKCPDYMDSCSFLNISGPASICKLDNVYTYYAARNKSCIQSVQWSTEGPLTVIAQTGTSLTVKFNGFGSFKIACLLPSACSPQKDSVMGIVNPPHPLLNLGRDTSICPGNTYTIHAGSKFLNYQWQDGSTDSVYKAKQAGSYWVKVMDTCGNIQSDTVTISPFYTEPITIGPDRVKCDLDTIHLEGPDGYISYNWGNDYAISSLISRQVVVKPLMDTSYFLRAEKKPGCFVFDTVRIKVYHAPAIWLGNDTSFCKGASLVLDAGQGFGQYQWNNGASTESLTVTESGIYLVKGITAEGCAAGDTLMVRTVFPLPQVVLDHDPGLCLGTTRTLDAGSFASYLWQDGSTSERFIVRDTGTYYVRVSDNHQCKASDTIQINFIRSLPANFLPADTAICSYGTLILKSDHQYSSYLWSNGSNSSNITISDPGTYWLQVKDNHDCNGRDTIIVAPKDCMKGLYVPSGFTPNGDGKNDQLHALIFGPVQSFEFTLYNRWGNIVFKTFNPALGWDGSLKGQPLDTGVYIWTCRYQLRGEKEKMEKGTVVLIR
jgi:gliding motility-associated-like protein